MNADPSTGRGHRTRERYDSTRRTIAISVAVGALLLVGGQALAEETLGESRKKACNQELTTFCKGVMILIATVVAGFVTSGGRSAWFVGVLLLMVYLVFAMTLYLLPPRAQGNGGSPAPAHRSAQVE